MEERIEPSRRSGRIINDPELLAMADIAQTMDGLDGECRFRIMQWANHKYGAFTLPRVHETTGMRDIPHDGPSFDE